MALIRLVGDLMEGNQSAPFWCIDFISTCCTTRVFCSAFSRFFPNKLRGIRPFGLIRDENSRIDP